MARTEAPRGPARASAAGAAGVPLREADAALADRFRRVLGSARRDAWVPPDEPAPPLTTAVAFTPLAAELPDGPVMPAPADPKRVPPVPGLLDDEQPAAPRDPAVCAGPEEQDAAQPPPAAPDAAAAFPATPATAPWSWAHSGGHGGGPPQHEAPPGSEAHTIDVGPEPPWLRDTADFVGSLCAGVDAGFQTWRMTVPLAARQLPDTQLELSLSPHTLCLRFRAAAPEPARLVLRYRQHLLDLLGQVPGLPPHIEIELD